MLRAKKKLQEDDADWEVGGTPEVVNETVWTELSKKIQDVGDLLIAQLDSEDTEKWEWLCSFGKSASKALQGAPFVGPAFGIAGLFFGQLGVAFENCREVIFMSLEILLMLEIFSEIGRTQGFKDDYWKKSAGRLHIQMLMRALKNANAAKTAITKQDVVKRTAMAGANRRRIEEASEKLHTARRNFCEALITNTVLNLEATLAVIATSAKQEGSDDIILKGSTMSMLYKSPQTETVGCNFANYLQGEPECMAYIDKTKHKCMQPAVKVYRVTGKDFRDDENKIEPAVILCVCGNHSRKNDGFLNKKNMRSIAELVYSK